MHKSHKSHTHWLANPSGSLPWFESLSREEEQQAHVTVMRCAWKGQSTNKMHVVTSLAKSCRNLLAADYPTVLQYTCKTHDKTAKLSPNLMNPSDASQAPMCWGPTASRYPTVSQHCRFVACWWEHGYKDATPKDPTKTGLELAPCISHKSSSMIACA